MAGAGGDTLTALQNGVQAINNFANKVTTAFSTIPQATTPGGSSGQVQFNNSGSFGGFTLGGDATLVSSAGSLTISSHAITYGKIQAESSGTLLGNLGTGSTSPSEQVSSAVTAFIQPFSSAIQGVVNAPSTTQSNSGFYVGGDNAFHTYTTPGFVYVGTVTTISSQIVDTSTTSNIINANSTTYRSFQLILKNIVPAVNSAQLSLQVHSGGAFQTATYLTDAFGSNNGGAMGTTNFPTGIPIAGSAVTNAAPGLSCQATVSNLGSTAAPKMWFGTGGFTQGSGTTTWTFSGYWNGGNGAIDGFQIASSQGAITSGNVDVYGML